MERRSFLFSLCGVGAAAVGLTSATAAKATEGAVRCRIVNGMDRSICLKVIGPFPGEESHPERGGVLFPEEEYFDNLGGGKRVVLAWDHMGTQIVTLQEIDIAAPCRIDVLEGKVVVTCDV